MSTRKPLVKNRPPRLTAGISSNENHDFADFADFSRVNRRAGRGASGDDKSGWCLGYGGLNLSGYGF